MTGGRIVAPMGTLPPRRPDGLSGVARRAAERARQSARILKDEYAKGRDGDEGPTQVLWDRPTFDQFRALVRSRKATPHDAPASADRAASQGGPADNREPHSASHPSELITDSEPATDSRAVTGSETRSDDDMAAQEVSMVLERVDWQAVGESTRSRSGEVADRLRLLAADVDWDRVRPAAGRVAAALVAAAATGQLGRLSGPTAQAVARAINGEAGVADAASSIISRRPGGAAAASVMKTFLSDRPQPWSPPAPGTAGPEPIIIDGVEVIPAGAFEARLAELRHLTTDRHPAG